MSKTKENLLVSGILILVAVFTTLLFILIIPAAKPYLGVDSQEVQDIELQSIQILSIGDSLTEGVGDSTNSGGFIPLLQKELSQTNSFESIKINNNGKSGNTTKMLIAQINGSDELQELIKNTDLITITIGANDLMKVVKANLLKEVTMEIFDIPKENYLRDLNELYSLIRSLNSEATIYHLGIYNPYYQVFEEIEQLQDIMIEWNQITEGIVNQDKNAFFIPISEQMQGADATLDSLLSDEDFFHPNDVGYKIIAKAFKDKIMETKQEWN